jgi:hypothetical protein
VLLKIKLIIPNYFFHFFHLYIHGHINARAHSISLCCFGISSITNKYVQLVIFHLFFAEIGNVAFISEHVFYKDGAWGIYVTVWFALSRIAWVICIIFYQWKPMLFSHDYPRPLKCIDIVLFVPSLLLCLGSLTYSFLFLQHELGYGMGDYIIVDGRR